ncbi:Glucoamylase [Mycena chlorophos]|uniref:glucan 1,4-alpha-glucosidase n=1 Tax=Mycena chlorophos TaxID=658473 RepID=A0A8H6VXT7_MYCCL|nr:Glucoamylase [Mycena chlorophos]
MSATLTVLGKRQRSHFVLQVSTPGPSKPAPVIINGTLVQPTNKKRYQCTHPGCLKAYSKPSRLEEHERSHTGDRPFSCDTCSKTFLRESHLHAHSRSHLPESDRPFVCGEQGCTKRFWTAQHLRVHTDWHNGAKPFVCPEDDCGESFAKNHQLRTHRATAHAAPGTKPYQCEHEGCSKSFATNQHLRQHSKVHDEKRYTCSNTACLSEGSLVFFPTWTALQLHNRTVHPPTCTHASCNGRIFSSQHHLRNHLKLHEQQEAEAAFDAGLPSDSEDRPRKKRRGGEFGRDWKCEMEDCGKDFKSVRRIHAKRRSTRTSKSPISGDETSCAHTTTARSRSGINTSSGGTLPRNTLLPPNRLDSDDDEDEFPSSPVPAAPQLDIATITGDAYAQNARQKLAAAVALRCPFPDLHGFGEIPPELECAGATSSRPCEYVFSRAYDLRRHLQSTHGVILEKDVVQNWVRRAKEARDDRMRVVNAESYYTGLYTPCATVAICLCTKMRLPSLSSVFSLAATVHALSTPDFYLNSMLANIGPSGSKVSGAAPGLVIASPSKNNPDYFYTWTRDSSLVFKTLIDQYRSGDNLELKPLIEQFIQAETKLQSVANPSGNISSGGLGEPKFNADMSAFTGAWGRPQRDGPALRAIAVMTYTNDASVWPMVKADLDYVLSDWNLSTFDLWEEVNSSGSFFTSAAQHRALRQGAALAQTLGYTSIADAYAAAADNILCFLQSYWNDAGGFIMANKNGGRSGKDANTVLASIHTFDPAAGCDALTFQPCSDRALANLKVYVDAFRSIYGINAWVPSTGAVATGRYPEDGYMGGNPWYLTTLAVAEQLYRAVYVWKMQGSLQISTTSLPFFRQFSPDAAVGEYKQASPLFPTLVQAITAHADGFVAVVDKYTPAGGNLAEQYSRANGAPLSASDLTWSYAAALTALDAKNGEIGASAKWGAGGLVLNGGCGSGSANGNGNGNSGGNAGGSGGGSSPQVQVDFHLTVSLSQGETAFVVGSLPALMEWNPDKAIPLTATNATTQSVTLSLPANTNAQYKYIRKSNGAVKWEADPNRSLNTPTSGTLDVNDAWNAGASAPTRVTVTFRETVSVNADERVFLVGSIPELKQWNTNDAIPLTQVSSNPAVWSVNVDLPANTQTIEYKYIRKSTSNTRLVWEADPNRQISTGGSSTMTENDTWR